MSVFEEFLEVQGPAIDCTPVAEEMIARYANVLPEQLLDHWREMGLCGYDNGMLWVVDPDDLREPLAEWLGSNAADAYPIVRTALGDIIFWKNDAAFYLNVLNGRGEVTRIVDDIEVLFFYTLCSAEFLDKGLGRDMFREALPRLGRLGPDECYTFMPALALGGSFKAEKLQRVKLRENLSILAGLRS